MTFVKSLQATKELRLSDLSLLDDKGYQYNNKNKNNDPQVRVQFRPKQHVPPFAF